MSSSNEYRNASDLVRFNRGFDSSEIDQSDAWCEKQMIQESQYSMEWYLIWVIMIKMFLVQFDHVLKAGMCLFDLP
jgi:hypothetical protein